jgi:Tat protein translocase TatB subunit
MLNVGPLELLVVLAVALIVVGPERLPELARSVGRAVRQLRQIQDEVRDMVATGVDDDVRQAANEFKKATGDIARAAGTATAPRKVGRTVREEVRKTVRPTPPRGPRTDGPSLPDAEAPPPEPADRTVTDAPPPDPADRAAADHTSPADATGGTASSETGGADIAGPPEPGTTSTPDQRDGETT